MAFFNATVATISFRLLKKKKRKKKKVRIRIEAKKDKKRNSGPRNSLEQMIIEKK